MASKDPLPTLERNRSMLVVLYHRYLFAPSVGFVQVQTENCGIFLLKVVLLTKMVHRYTYVVLLLQIWCVASVSPCTKRRVVTVPFPGQWPIGVQSTGIYILGITIESRFLASVVLSVITPERETERKVHVYKSCKKRWLKGCCQEYGRSNKTMRWAVIGWSNK